MAPEAGSVLSPGPHRWADFIALDGDDRRELIDGQLLDIDVPNKIHEWIVILLGTYLTSWALPRRAGTVLASGYKVRIRDDRGVMPDLQFFRRGGRPLPDRGLEHGAPDLAVEIVSPTSARFDRVVKLDWYASIGTAEYWIVDPEQRTLERYLLHDGSLEQVASLEGEDTFTPETFPGLAIDLAQLWTTPDE